MSLENGGKVSKKVQRSAFCRSRRELSNADLLAKFGIDTAENEPWKVCPLSVYRSRRYMKLVGKMRRELDTEERNLLSAERHECLASDV